MLGKHSPPPPNDLKLLKKNDRRAGPFTLVNQHHEPVFVAGRNIMSKDAWSLKASFQDRTQSLPNAICPCPNCISKPIIRDGRACSRVVCLPPLPFNLFSLSFEAKWLTRGQWFCSLSNYNCPLIMSTLQQTPNTCSHPVLAR